MKYDKYVTEFIIELLGNGYTVNESDGVIDIELPINILGSAHIGAYDIHKGTFFITKNQPTTPDDGIAAREYAGELARLYRINVDET